MVGRPAGLATKPRRGQRGSPHIALEIPATLERAGMGVRLVVQGELNDSSPDHSLIRLLIRAFAIRDTL